MMKIDQDDRRIFAMFAFGLFAMAITLLSLAAILGAAVQTFRWVGGF